MKSTPLFVFAISASLITTSCKPSKKENSGDDRKTTSGSSAHTSDPKVDLSQMKRQIEQDFRRFFPNAVYRDVDKEYSDMNSFVSEMISSGTTLVNIYPEKSAELQQWRNLQGRMSNYNRLRQQGD